MVELLSDYFAAMTSHVFTFEGTLKEYVGDELMAIFGAPVPQEDHALKACLTALAMRDELRQLRRTWPALGRPALRARIGINSGPMLVGNLGSPYRFSYGVVGDQVNLASRLEGLAGLYGVDILIGENTVELIRDELVVRELDWVRVKGREQQVRIFELVGQNGSTLPPEQREANACYAQGLFEYRRRSWHKALENFEQAGEVWTQDRPAAVMAERCQLFQESPPPEDWEGVFEHRSKK
jgi:adenylate cyclase